MPSRPEAAGPFAPRPLGSTGLQVTPICIGTASLGNMPETFAYEVPEERALATIRAFFASRDNSGTHPLNFLDTAASYGDGESERRIGKILGELGGLPPGYVLATKADRDLQTGSFTGAQMRRSVERSLRLLGLEQLQLVYLHDPEHISFEEAMQPDGPVEVLQQCKAEGLIAHLGVAGGPIDLMIRFVETGLFEAAISHNRFTLLNREAEPLWEVCARRGVAMVNAAPYGSGLLAKGPRAYPRYMYDQAPSELLRRAGRMEEACERHGLPLAAAALQFSLRDPRITSTIVGVTRPARITETLKLAQQPIPDELWIELDSIYQS
ncbi:MAG TPA: aldo/keto reductase [Ktedonobacteraceae bacterium]|nr:aldo/keto reductase [Ktedonobacteraceae bacterium]